MNGLGPFIIQYELSTENMNQFFIDKYESVVTNEKNESEIARNFHYEPFTYDDSKVDGFHQGRDDMCL